MARTGKTWGCLRCWHHSDLQFVPISSGIDKDLEKTAFSRVAFLAYLLMLSEIIIRERRAEKPFSHPIQCLQPWKVPLFSSAPNPGPWTGEGEKPGLEEKGFFRGHPTTGDIHPVPIPSSPEPDWTTPWVSVPHVLGQAISGSLHMEENARRATGALLRGKWHLGKHLGAILCARAVCLQGNLWPVGVPEVGQLGSLRWAKWPLAGSWPWP